MANFTIDNTFSTTLAEIETTSSVHKNTDNAVYSRLINNDAAEHYFINVKEHGAVGDGVTDDTAAIQAALDAVATTKLAVFVPPGTYLCNVSMPDATCLFGTGPRTGTILKPFTDAAVVTIDSSSTARQNVEVHGLHILGDVTKASQDAILFTGNGINDWHKFSNLYITLSGRDGIHVDGRLIWASFQNTQIKTSERHGVFMDISAAGSGQINLCNFINVSCNGGKNHGWRIVGDSVGQIPQQCALINCESGSNSDGTNTVHGFYFTSVRGFNMINCWAETNGFDPTAADSTGLFIDGTFSFANSVWGGNYVEHNYGIRVEGGASNANVLTIDGGVRLNDGTVASSQSGLKVDANSMRVTYGDVWNGYTTPIDDVADGSAKKHVQMRSPLASALHTIVGSDATPSVALSNLFLTANGSSTTITMFDDGFTGQEITVIVNDTNTTIDFTGTNLLGNVGVDWSPTTGDHMTCVYDGTNWHCRVSDNTA